MIAEQLNNPISKDHQNTKPQKNPVQLVDMIFLRLMVDQYRSTDHQCKNPVRKLSLEDLEVIQK